MANDFGSMLNELILQSQGTSVPSNFIQPEVTNPEIVRLKQQMAGLTNTDAGINILKSLINNQSSTLEERTAAAETLNPGVNIQINSDNSFSVGAPQTNVGFGGQSPQINPAEQRVAELQNQQTRVTSAASRAPELLNSINERFAIIQSETNITKLSDNLTQLNASISDFTLARTQELRDQSRKLFGIDNLEAQVAQDQLLDRQESQEMYGVDYLGPSQASLATLRNLQMQQAKADEWFKMQSSNDAVLSAIQTKQQLVLSTAEGKYKQLGQEAMGQEFTDFLMSNNRAIEAAAIALGNDPATMSPDVRRQVALSLKSNDAYTTHASEVALSPARVPQYLSEGGSKGNLARNTLVYQAKGDTKMVDDMISAYNNFEVWSEMSPAELERNGLVPPTKLSAEQLRSSGTSDAAREQRLAQVQVTRWNFIRKAYADKANGEMLLMQGFESPQSSDLTEWDDTVRTTQAAAEHNNEGPVIIQDVIANLSWPEDSLLAEKKKESLVQYLKSQAAKKTNSLIGAPPEFANDNTIRAYIDMAIINRRVKETSNSWLQTAGYFGGALATGGGIVGIGLGLPLAIGAAKEKDAARKTPGE